MEEEQFEEDEDEIHYMEDKGSAAFLTLATYEESLLWNKTVKNGIEKLSYKLNSNRDIT